MWLSSFYRRMPIFRGKRRLLRALLGGRLEQMREIYVQSQAGCQYVLPNLSDSISFDLYCNGSYESETVDFLSSRLQVGGTFLDLGANIGAITIPLKRRIDRLRVICVEAAPWIANYLQRNLELNFLENERPTIINRALFTRSGEQVPFFSPEIGFGRGSLSPVFTKEPLIVETVALDDLVIAQGLERVDLIKIDIEGFECDAFKGGARLLSGPDAPDIVFEFVDWAEQLANQKPGTAQKLLLDFGYRLYRIDHDLKPRHMSDCMVEGEAMIFASKRAQ
jgi:FkbM family methyltransferase